MKKMVKVILVCTAVLCAIDQIMRFTGPYAIAHIWNDMVLDGNYAAADAVHHFDSCMKFQPVHFCKGGHVGIGDFAGFERVDNARTDSR